MIVTSGWDPLQRQLALCLSAGKTGYSHSDISFIAVSLPCKLGLSEQAKCMCSNAQWLP